MLNAKRLLRAALVILSTAAAASAGQTGPDAGPAVSTSASMDVLSHYVWRGLRLSEGLVLQPTVGVEHGGLSANLWWNFDGAGDRGPGSGRRLTETDITVAYSRPVGGASVTGGVIYYGMRGGPDTTELYASWKRESLLEPAVTIYYDVDEGDGALAVLSIGHEMALGRGALALAASASWNLKHKVMGPGTSGKPFAGPYHGELGMSLAIPIGTRLSVAPRAVYTFPLGDNARHALEFSSWDGKTSRLLSGGIGIVAEF